MLTKLAFLLDVQSSETNNPADVRDLVKEVERTPGGVATFNALLAGAVMGAVAGSSLPELQSFACGEPVKQMRELLEHGADTLAHALELTRATHISASAGWFDVLKLLLGSGADPRGMDHCLEQWETLSLHEIPFSYLPVIQSMGKLPPLHSACLGGHMECVQFLVVALKADHPGTLAVVVNDQQNSHFVTPLMCAAQSGNAELCRWLIEVEHADVHLRRRPPSGSKPSSKASRNPHRFTGAPASFFAAQMGNVDALKVLVEHGASLEDVDDAATTLVIVAAMCGQSSVLEYLFNQGSMLSPGLSRGGTKEDQRHRDTKHLAQQRDASGGFALFWAAVGGHLDCIRLLVETARVDVNATNKGYTALMVACGSKVYFKKAKHDVPLFKTEGETKESDMNAVADHPVVAYLLSKGADPHLVHPKILFDALNFSCCARNVSAVKTLLSVPSMDVNRTCLAGMTYLMTAIDHFDRDLFVSEKENVHHVVSICTLLLDAGCDVNASLTTGSDLAVGRTALKLAKNMWSKDDPELIALLEQRGALSRTAMQKQRDALYDQRVKNGEDEWALLREKGRALKTLAGGMWDLYGSVFKDFMKMIGVEKRSNDYLSRMVYICPSVSFEITTSMKNA